MTPVGVASSTTAPRDSKARTASEHTATTSGSTWPETQVGRPGHPPSGDVALDGRSHSRFRRPGTLFGSESDGPDMTENINAAVRDGAGDRPVEHVRVMPPVKKVCGMRPSDGLNPNHAAHRRRMRTEPAPSAPSANGPSPEATAAAAPPLEPPAVWPCFHGLWVGP